jgi:hypothetical protein
MEPCYTVWPVGIDKSWHIGATCEFTICNALNCCLDPIRIIGPEKA